MYVSLKKVRKHPVSLTLVVIIWVVCLIPIPENPLSHVALIDKWTHFGMYGMLCLIIWLERLFIRNGSSLSFPSSLGNWCVCLLLPMLMGGLVELAQANLTTCRSGEWLDFAANSIGVLLGNILGAIVYYLSLKRQRTE